MVRTLVSRNAQLIMRVYKSIIRPNLEYASSVWNPVSPKLTKSIERVQHKITKLILGQTLSYQNRLETLHLPTLKWRRNYLDLIRVYTILTTNSEESIAASLFTLNSEVSKLNLRRHCLTIRGETAHTNLYKNQFTNRVIVNWNSLPPDIVNLTNFVSFKKALKTHLMSTGSPYSENQ